MLAQAVAGSLDLNDDGVVEQPARLRKLLYRSRAGIPWRDLPERFGDWKNVHRRLAVGLKAGCGSSSLLISRPTPTTSTR